MRSGGEAEPQYNRPETEASGPLWKRLAWMATIWLGSVSVLGAVAMVIRWWLSP